MREEISQEELSRIISESVQETLTQEELDETYNVFIKTLPVTKRSFLKEIKTQ